ncbi:MAG: nucleoside triphosphate pyrophosphohydrolase [Marinifilaceae bacterium]
MRHNKEEKKEAFEQLLDVIKTLRSQCPWDKKQTIQSLRPLTIEETFELADAIMDNNTDEVCKELGDLIMHIVFYAQIAEEHGQFDIADVLNGICEKLKYRHPHIYGDVKADTPEEVLKNWEQLKLKEKGRNNRVLEGVPNSLPSLVKAYRIQDKARGVGFDWANREDVWNKVKEEIAEFEIEAANCNEDKMEEEFGDLFFSLINAARLYKVNPENALERCNKKFIRRFTYLEDQCLASGKNINDLTLEEMDALWNEAKKTEKK